MSNSSRLARVLFCLAALPTSSWAQTYSQEVVTVDYAIVVGAFQPVHGVNQGNVKRTWWTARNPWLASANANHYAAFANSNVPQSRGHDQGAGDMFEIWTPRYPGTNRPMFSAAVDPYDDANYNFGATDDWIDSLTAALPNAEVVLRLGESESEDGQGLWHLNDPPEDPAVFASVAEQIILHCIGRGATVTAVELWNEPYDPHWWNGTAQEYFDLYEECYRRLYAATGGSITLVPHVAWDAYATPDPEPDQFSKAFLDSCVLNAVPVRAIAPHWYRRVPSFFISEAIGWRDYFTAHQAPAPLLYVTEWNRTIDWSDPNAGFANIASLAHTMCSLYYLNELAADPNGVGYGISLEQAHMYPTNGIGFSLPGDTPTLRGVTWEVYGRRLYGMNSTRVLTSPPTDEILLPIPTSGPPGRRSFVSMAGRSPSLASAAIVMSSYKYTAQELLPTTPSGAALVSIDLNVLNLPWSKFSWVRYSHRTDDSALTQVDSGVVSGSSTLSLNILDFWENTYEIIELSPLP